MLAKFREQVEWCLCLKDSGLRVCDLILGPTNNRVRPTVCLEEAARRLLVMQDEHRKAVVELMALRSSATWVWDLVRKGSDEMSYLAASLSLVVDLVDGRVDTVAANEVHWGPGWHSLLPCRTCPSWRLS
jgi:hypothetical protein